MKKSWVVITGASRGLGAHLASAFWNSGWSIGLIGRDRESLSPVINGLNDRDGQTIASFFCDLSQSEAVSSLIDEIKGRLFSLDVLINNAAIHGPIGPLVSNNLKLWNEAMQVNFLTPVALCHGLTPLLVASGNGSIINLSGGGAASPRANFTAYASAKAALVRFSETLAQEVQPHNVRVNCIAPGVMKTALLKEVLDAGMAVAGKQEFETANQVFGKGFVSMEKAVELALFLASNQSLGITGKLISANWDCWSEWPKHIDQLRASDVYTLRRITGRERAMEWGDI